jgi:hypothetical protein
MRETNEKRRASDESQKLFEAFGRRDASIRWVIDDQWVQRVETE